MNRKIMVEVTPQEYEKIQAGKLNVEDMTVEELINQLRDKIGEPVDCELLWDGENLASVSKFEYEYDKHHSFTLITRTVEHRTKGENK